MLAASPDPFHSAQFDVDEVVRDLERLGYSVVRGLLSAERAANLGRRCRALMDPTAGYDKRAGALDELPELAPLCEHPGVLEVVERFFGRPFYLANNVNMFWAQPGAPGGEQHCDWPTWEMPEPYPPWPAFLQTMWLLTEFTEENGATRFVPGSHLWGERPPTEGRFEGEVAASGPAGSLLLWNGAAWHRNPPNTTSDAHRLGVGPGYIPRWLHRPVDGWPLLRREVWERLSPRLRQLTERSVEPAS